MKINDLRPQFHAYFLAGDPLAEKLKQEGYSVECFSSEYELIQTAQETPPHFVGGTLAGLDFLENIKNLSDEIKIIHSVQDADDEAVEFLVQNELQHKPVLPPEIQFQTPLTETNDKTQSLLDFYNQSFKLQEEWLGALVQKASALIDSKPALYLKYLPAQRVLVLKRAAGLNENELRRVGVPLGFLDPEEVEKKLTHQPEKIDILIEMLKSVFGLLEYTILPLTTKRGPQGVLILFRRLRVEANRNLLSFYLAVTQDKIYQLELESEANQFQDIDTKTGLLTESAFGRKVTLEVSRARRIEKSAVLILLEIDHFQKYKQANGSVMAEVITKSLSQILHKSFRNSDIIGKLGEGKLAILCPHSEYSGLVKKAEKLREVLLTTPFPYGEKQPIGKLTVSMGLSCFPLVSDSATQLWKTAEEALELVRRGGRNRVCKSEAPKGYKPEFGADDRT